jgi:hypothetical protein
MDKGKIIEFLQNNGMSEVTELPYKDDIFVVRFFYDFDEDELKAAKAFAKDESEEEEESEVWYDEYFLPYLNDIAIDNTGEIIEDAIEEFDIQAQYVSYEADVENHDYCEFIAAFYKESNIEIETILDELNI